MLDPDDRDALRPQLLDRGDEGVDLLLREAPCDLVQQEHLGLGREGPRELQALALEKRQTLAEHVGAGQQLSPVERPGAYLLYDARSGCPRP